MSFDAIKHISLLNPVSYPLNVKLALCMSSYTSYIFGRILLLKLMEAYCSKIVEVEL